KPLDAMVPPERRGRVAQMYNEVHQAYQKVSAVQEVKLPSGKTVTFASCEAITDADERGVCEGLFIEVTGCRNNKSGEELVTCEKKAIADYIELRGVPDDALDTLDEEYP